MKTVSISSGGKTRRKDQSAHSSGSRSPVLVLQVVALPVDPANCLVYPAVDTLSPADVVRCSFQLRNINTLTFPYSSTDLVKGPTVGWNTQLLDGLENGVLESKEKTTVDRDDVCSVVDRYKRYRETRILCGLLSFYEFVDGNIKIFSDGLFLVLSHRCPDRIFDGIKVDQIL